MDKPLRFIVIDDDTVANLITSRMIKLYLPDAPIDAFTDSVVALEGIRVQTEKDTHCTIVFLDINMPGLNGWEFLDAFNGLGDCVGGQFRIYMLSSSIDKRDKDRAGIYPCVAGMLSKPLLPDHIKAVLKEL